jgi:alkaline phosphatase D
MGEPVTAARVAAWRDAWGPDWWVEEAGEWVLIGIDSMLFGSDLRLEQEQTAWLAQVARSAGERPVAVFLHKPAWLWGRGEPSDQMAMVPAGWQRLRDALGRTRVRVFGSGHMHQFRASVLDGQAAVWAPSTSFVSAGPSPFGGVKAVGAVEYLFEGRSVTWRLVRPDGMVDLDVAVLAAGAESLRFAPPLPVP